MESRRCSDPVTNMYNRAGVLLRQDRRYDIVGSTSARATSWWCKKKGGFIHPAQHVLIVREPVGHAYTIYYTHDQCSLIADSKNMCRMRDERHIQQRWILLPSSRVHAARS